MPVMCSEDVKEGGIVVGHIPVTKFVVQDKFVNRIHTLAAASDNLVNSCRFGIYASNEKAAAPGHVIEKETIPFSRTLRMRRLRNSPDG